MKLLVADDEMTIRRGMQMLDWGSIGIDQVYAAENGIQAKEILEQQKIDIVISDIQMPGLTGLDLAEYVKGCGLDTAVILLTGFSDFSYAQKAIQNEVVDYMLKPLRPKDILSTVSGVMKKLEARRHRDQIYRQYEMDADSEELQKQIAYCFRDSNRQLLQILLELAEHYQEDITLNSMADEHHFSVSYLSRMIKKETGYSFSEILNSIRLVKAAELLYNDKIKIGMVSEKAGYRDARYFSQVFRKVFECSPGEFKKGASMQKKYNIKTILELLRERR